MPFSCDGWLGWMDRWWLGVGRRDGAGEAAVGRARSQSVSQRHHATSAEGAPRYTARHVSAATRSAPRHRGGVVGNRLDHLGAPPSVVDGRVKLGCNRGAPRTRRSKEFPNVAVKYASVLATLRLGVPDPLQPVARHRGGRCRRLADPARRRRCASRGDGARHAAVLVPNITRARADAPRGHRRAFRYRSRRVCDEGVPVPGDPRAWRWRRGCCSTWRARSG